MKSIGKFSLLKSNEKFDCKYSCDLILAIFLGTLKIILFCSDKFVDFSVKIGDKILIPTPIEKVLEYYGY